MNAMTLQNLPTTALTMTSREIADLTGSTPELSRAVKRRRLE